MRHHGHFILYSRSIDIIANNNKNNNVRDHISTFRLVEGGPGKLDRKIVGKALMPQYWGCVPPPTDKNYFREKSEIMGGWGVKVLNPFW